MNINKLLKDYMASDNNRSIDDIIKEAIESQNLGDTPEKSPKKDEEEEEEEYGKNL